MRLGGGASQLSGAFSAFVPHRFLWRRKTNGRMRLEHGQTRQNDSFLFSANTSRIICRVRDRRRRYAGNISRRPPPTPRSHEWVISRSLENWAGRWLRSLGSTKTWPTRGPHQGHHRSDQQLDPIREGTVSPRGRVCRRSITPMSAEFHDYMEGSNRIVWFSSSSGRNLHDMPFGRGLDESPRRSRSPSSCWMCWWRSAARV